MQNNQPFRDNNHDRSEPVTHSKEDYTRGRWQMDAHALWRSSGDRFLTIEDLAGLPHDEMFRACRRWMSGPLGRGQKAIVFQFGTPLM